MEKTWFLRASLPCYPMSPLQSSAKLAHGRRLARNLVREGKGGGGKEGGKEKVRRERGRTGITVNQEGKELIGRKAGGVVELSSAPHSLLGLPACILQLISLRVMASGIQAICLGP